MSDLFISYAREDLDFVRRLYTTLDELDREVWVDFDEIRPSEDWFEAICSVIRQADAFIFIISPDSVQSEVCPLEIEHALEHHKRIILFISIANERYLFESITSNSTGSRLTA